MWEKIEAVLNHLWKSEYINPVTGQASGPASKAYLVSILNEGALHLKAGNQTPSNVNQKMARPTRKFLHMLNFSLGLDDLGVSTDIWRTEDPVQICNYIKRLQNGSPLRMAAKLTQHRELITLGASQRLGLEMNEDRTRLEQFFKSPEIVIQSGMELQIEVALPFEGFVRIIAYEEGEFFGLNLALGLDAGLLPASEYSKLEQLPLSETVPRTAIMAFASHHDMFEGWPLDNNSTGYRTTQQMLELIGAYSEIPENQRAQRITSFLTRAA